jgi:16S rRNA (uracil1498-N3)-methyltransferase
MQLFYVPDVSGNEIVLDEAESKHAVKVLRLSEHDPVTVIDGKGGFYHARISDANPKKCRMEVLHVEKEFGKKEYWLHIAIPPTKNIDRFEWFLEKATEIGINEITPILTDHSERKIIKTDRLEKIMVSAIKQSLKAYLPILNPLTPLKELMAKTTIKNRFIAHCGEGEKVHLKNEIKKGEDVLVLIGPEGDFSPEEVELAKKHGFREVSLGTSRLRTETAGMAACHMVNLGNE